MPDLEEADVQTPELAPQPGIPRGTSGAPLPPPPAPAMWTNAAQPTAGPPPIPAGGDIFPALRARVANLPLEQAEQAVAAALKYQAVRGYQQDIAAGKDSAESLAKWAPLMFTAPKTATLGQAASMVRARPQMQKPMNVGGIAYKVNPDGSMTPLTPGRPTPAPRPNTFDVSEHREILKQIADIEKDLDAAPYGKEADEKRQKLQYLRTQATEVRTRGTPAGPAAPTAPTGTGTNAPPKVTSQAEYDRLPSGAIYIGKNGRRYRKP